MLRRTSVVIPSTGASPWMLLSSVTSPMLSPPFFFFNDPATTEIYTLSLHDALPILPPRRYQRVSLAHLVSPHDPGGLARSEEHTSELQSPVHLVCRLLLEKKKQ